ncbi:hypothetical protein LMH87_007145 [Akanthomyces muscarius]|uniref:Uncharacterized protein n=1 Tax=Akanthomyces muscarius TaxID=2231603 RepID=A0A9W8QR05_AKAMU|nr:hypothetical protein LMH87_007145 [Akanthomyces muscarius]KAJ4165515.1 hypothetical protein LMH87_007145 [Akanthomyces muscarius]
MQEETDFVGVARRAGPCGVDTTRTGSPTSHRKARHNVGSLEVSPHVATSVFRGHGGATRWYHGGSKAMKTQWYEPDYHVAALAVSTEIFTYAYFHE